MGERATKNNCEKERGGKNLRLKVGARASLGLRKRPHGTFPLGRNRSRDRRKFSTDRKNRTTGGKGEKNRLASL